MSTPEENTDRINRLERAISFLLDAQLEEGLGEDMLTDQPIDPQVILGDSSYNSLFEIYDIDADARTFSIRGDVSNGDMGSTWDPSGVAIAHVWTDLDDGTGFTLTGTDYEAADLGDSVAVSWVWIELNRATTGQNAEIKVGTTLSDGDDDTEIFPLWRIPVILSGGSNVIDTDNIMDYRHTKHWSAGA